METTFLDASPKLRAGKLPHAMLAELLRTLPTQDPQLLLGPIVGEDAAVIDFDPASDRLLVVKSDPITFATDQIGYYAVNICANDLAVTGATPRFFLPTVLLPAESADLEMANAIFEQIGRACQRLNVVVAGGHSEVTPTVSQPVVAGAMLGEVERSHFVRSGGSRPGDLVLLVGCVPIEGTSIIAREMRSYLLVEGWSPAELDEAANYLFEPGISVLEPALAAARAGLVTAMHDPTEGGLATGVLELAMASEVGVEIDLDQVPVSELSRRLCAAFGLDPLGTLASGALLATASPSCVEPLLHLWESMGRPARVIGRILPANEGCWAVVGHRRTPFPTFTVDEITKLWAPD
ncbi:AIR synthase family protein [Caldilinea sp.]|uniref:AIR synthase family protein n=1 Tax=Caldilinea sp. TaxID=2293560 RepID=UPI00262CF717|nr:AIR synthase family protein [uncultured Caldilinea sp.]